MDGYSIQEAAEVLGVPKRRIRELVAHGVILGSQEDDGELRVYLQPRPPASIRDAAESDPGFEASPFRELLTEFRNLTERYGQALLALGESRGEVAALRGRIEALETRVDLRLGMASPSVVEWHAPPAFEAETLADLGGSERPVDETVDQAAVAESAPPLTDAEASDDAVVASAAALLAEAEATDESALAGATQVQDESPDEVQDVADEAATDVEASDETFADDAGAGEEGFESTLPGEALDENVVAEQEAPDAGREADDEGLDLEALAEPVVAEATEEPVSADAVTSEDQAPEEVAGPAEGTDADESRPARPRRAGFAAGGIAEALARAIDPSTAELPAPADIGLIDADEPAMNKFEDAGEALPIDESRYSAAVEEPDWLAEGDFTWLDAADREEPARNESQTAEGSAFEGANAEPAAPETPAFEFEPEPVVPEESAYDPEPEPDAFVAEEPEPEPVVAEEPEPEPVVAEEPEPEPVVAEEPEPEREPEAAFAAASDPQAGAEEIGAAVDENGDTAGEAEQPAEPDYAAPGWDSDWDFAATAYAVETTLPVERDPTGMSASVDADDDDDEQEAAAGEIEVTAVEVVEPHPDAAGPVTGVLPDEPIDVTFSPSQIIERSVVRGPDDREAAASSASAEPSSAGAHAAAEDTGEVALMWLGSEFDDREEYAAEIEVGTAGWHRPGGSDELTRIAEDQGWDATEVEAIRNLLEPSSEQEPDEAADADTSVEAAPAEDAHAEAPATQSQSESPLDETGQPVGRAEQVAVETRSQPHWPEEDRTVTFSLPGGDDLQRALEALGLPARSRSGGQADDAPPPSSAQRAAAPPAARAEPAAGSNEPAPRPNEPSLGQAPHPPFGEPEWLRGRRDPAARAFRRLRRIFPG